VAVLVRLRSDRCCSGRPATTPTRHGRAAALPRRQVRLRRPQHLAGPTTTHTATDEQDGTVTVHALEWAASQTAPPPWPRQPRTPPDRARHHPARPGPAHPARTRPPKVLWLWWAGPGTLDLDLTWRALCPPVRPGAHHPVLYANPGLDHPTAAPPRPGRPLDLAGAGRRPPATPGPRHRRRSAAAVGAPPTARPAVPLPGAAGVSAAVVRARLAGRGAETRRALPGSASRQPIRAREPLPGDQEAHQQAKEESHHSHQASSTAWRMLNASMIWAEVPEQRQEFHQNKTREVRWAGQTPGRTPIPNSWQ
jgi:hypothetical protein